MAQSILVAAKSKVAEFHLKLISWKPPFEDWTKINSDGSVFHNNNATCGVIIRYHHSRFLASFSANLGVCTITVAELWGMFFGLKIAHLMGKDKVVLEADSLCSVQICLQNPFGFHSCNPLITAIWNLYAAIGEVQIVHQFREANACADTLAKLGHTLLPGFHFFDSLPSCISLSFFADLSGATHPRVVAM